MGAEIHVTADRQQENLRFAYSFLPGTLFVLLLWLISLLTYLTDAKLSWLGIFPRNFFGLIGIVTGPLIHADLLHLLSNSFPFVLLSGFILFQFRSRGAAVLLFVYVLSGLLNWFIGRQAYHVGASGVIYGMAGFLLFSGFINRDRASLAVSLAILFLYGGLFYGLFPGEERVSWEGHLAGFMAGFLAALYFGKVENTIVREEDETEVPLQQKYTSHTLGNTDHQFFMQYTLSDKVPLTINYTIEPVKKAPSKPVESSSIFKTTMNNK